MFCLILKHLLDKNDLAERICITSNEGMFALVREEVLRGLQDTGTGGLDLLHSLHGQLGAQS